ncbi:MAG: hypothetical protein ABII00_00225 [Elusimicrobiota bacterium]
MDRKIVEQLRAGAAVKHIVRTLHVGKNRVRRIREPNAKYARRDSAAATIRRRESGHKLSPRCG